MLPLPTVEEKETRKKIRPWWKSREKTKWVSARTHPNANSSYASPNPCPGITEPITEVSRCPVLCRHLRFIETVSETVSRFSTGPKGLSEIEHTVRIVVPVGEEELRIWFPFRDGRGPNVSFVVPPSPSVNQKILGWILRLVFWAPQETSGQYQSVRQSLVFEDVIYNKIRFWSGKFHVAVSPTDVDQVLLIYIPQGYVGLQLEGGDEVEMPIYTEGKAVVKKWAIDVIYEADEIHKGNDTWCQVVSI